MSAADYGRKSVQIFVRIPQAQLREETNKPLDIQQKMVQK